MLTDHPDAFHATDELKIAVQAGPDQDLYQLIGSLAGLDIYAGMSRVAANVMEFSANSEVSGSGHLHVKMSYANRHWIEAIRPYR